MTRCANSDPAGKAWSRQYKYGGYPTYVPVHCSRCANHIYDAIFGHGASGQMCDDCKAISHRLSQRKYRETYGFSPKRDRL